MKGSGSGLTLASACLIASCVFAETAVAPVIGPGSYGQQLVARLAAKHPNVRAMTLYVTLPGGSGPESIASSDGATGSPPPTAAAQALARGRLQFAYDEGSRLLTAQVPMLDMSHKAAGVMTLMLTGTSRAALQSEALEIRDQLARRTSGAGNLVEKAVDDPSIPVHSYAQYIVDDELAKHPDVMVIAIHATTPKNSDPEILASNIGRIGKKADDDDMRVIREGKTNLEVDKDRMRYEVEVPLENSTGERIGALGVVFALAAHTNQEACQAEAIHIRNEIARRISTPAKLVEPYTASADHSSSSPVRTA